MLSYSKIYTFFLFKNFFPCTFSPFPPSKISIRLVLDLLDLALIFSFFYFSVRHSILLALYLVRML